MKISVCAPMLNESFFLYFWLNTVKEFADEIVIIDTGSKDNSRQSVIQFREICPIPIKLIHEDQNAGPFSAQWEQGKTRNKLLGLCSGDIVMPLDIDEIIDPQDGLKIKAIFENTQANALDLIWVTFWKDLRHVRVSTPWDMRWYGTPLTKAWRKGTYNYTDEARHCYPVPIAEELSKIRTRIPLYHLHYGFGLDHLKENDNRAFDLRGDSFDNEMGFFGPAYQLPYQGPWPEILRDELNKTIPDLG